MSMFFDVINNNMLYIQPFFIKLIVSFIFINNFATC